MKRFFHNVFSVVRSWWPGRQVIGVQRMPIFLQGRVRGTREPHKLVQLGSTPSPATILHGMVRRAQALWRRLGFAQWTRARRGLSPDPQVGRADLLSLVIVGVLSMTMLSGMGQPVPDNLTLRPASNFIYADHDTNHAFLWQKPSYDVSFSDSNFHYYIIAHCTNNYVVANLEIFTNYTGTIQVGTNFYHLASPVDEFGNHCIIISGEGIMVTNAYEMAFGGGKNPVGRIRLSEFEYEVIHTALKRTQWDKP